MKRYIFLHKPSQIKSPRVKKEIAFHILHGFKAYQLFLTFNFIMSDKNIVELYNQFNILKDKTVFNIDHQATLFA